MALKLEKELNNGIIADYWRIDEVRYIEKLVTINLYFNKDKDPIYQICVVIDIDKSNDSLCDIYNKIKLLPVFAGAADC